jgi:hypothetical protein
MVPIFFTSIVYAYKIQPTKTTKDKKTRNQRGGVLTPDTIRRLRDQYLDHARPNLMEIDEFVRENNIQEPFHEVVTYIRRDIIHALLAPIPEPENVSPERLEAFRAKVRRLAELARPRLS